MNEKHKEILQHPLCTPLEVISFTKTDSNVKVEYLERAIQIATDGELSSCIGIPLLNSFKWLAYNNGEDDFQETFHKCFITPFLAWKALKVACVDMSFKLNNSGVYTNDDEQKTQADFNVVHRIMQTYETNASGYLLRLTRALCDCSTQLNNTIKEVKELSGDPWWLQLDFYCSKTPLQIL